MMIINSRFLILLTLLNSINVLAQPDSFSKSLPYSVSISDNAKEQRFNSYGLNSATWQFNSKQDDNDALEGNYSFSYTWFDCRRGNEGKTETNLSFDTCLPDNKVNFASYLSYTGQFDFYMGTRHSGPVVNRISNPAIHFQWLLPKEDILFNYVDIGVEHRSDGQTIENHWRNRDGKLRTQEAYETNDYEYFDGLSRGANYINFSIGKNNNISNISWQISAKYYWHQDSDVNWGPLANKGIKFEDYDLINISLNYPLDMSFWLFKDAKLSGLYRFGKEFTDADSLDVSLLLPLKSERIDLPIFIKAHFGPFENLSNYTRSVTNVGVGLAFSF
ncbi:hypothetical protein [Colwellia sp. PAMC 21821]|uniref:hypothetical protein n=1 Tax=Colwellia sp. PAMC 21821 TaxID=1816219 RepID=UPI0009BE4621|nr:hypothetical protein [Colwellia sp. PAMC 21821]ARD45129.1 hypothetical protein A3Q33_12910 [Colwellia sp. PAMC 21821]